MSEQTLHLPSEGEKLDTGIVMDIVSAGGTSHVFKIWVKDLEVHRAVKVMSPGAGTEVRERFATEARPCF